jgi:tryptophanyl-tRNA synthetase
MKTIFSGLKPSGDMTIGNYLGAMKYWPKDQDKHRTIFFIPNLHAITVRQDPSLLKQRTFDLVAWLITVGVDPDKSIILVQSMVSEHAELAWILNNYVTMGEMSRMTQYKDKAKKVGPEGLLVGFFDYPALMAADILLYDTNEVPVGEDQVQHVELTRDIANRFNKLYGATFVLPQSIAPKTGKRIMGLDDPSKKMSKSDHPDSAIALMESTDSIVNKFKRAVTDSDNKIIYDKVNKPAISNLLEIYAGFAEVEITEVEKKYNGKGYGDFKKDLGELVSDKLDKLQGQYTAIRSNEAKLLQIVEQGNVKARQISNKKLEEVKEKIGLL